MAALDIDEAPFGDIPSILDLSRDIDLSPGEFAALIEVPEICIDPVEGALEWTIISPLEFSNLLKRDPIVVDLTFPEVSLLDLHISVSILSLGVDDVVFQNGRFSDKYQAYSTKRFTGTGQRFSIRRTEGWPVQDFDSEFDDIQLTVFGCQSSTLPQP